MVLLRTTRRHIISACLLCVLALGVPRAQTQTPSASAEHGIQLVESGRCKEALPPLKRALPRITDSTLRYRTAMALVRCAMALDQEQLAVDNILLLKREAPGNPEVLYIATHYFSELGMRSAKQLATDSPNSPQAQRLEAEALESQGKNDEAAAAYRKILESNPKLPGIHYHLGQIELDRAGASGSTDAAKQEFQKELEVDPTNASAEFVLGELARRAGDWNTAIPHFSHAAKLDAGFSEAYLALGMSYAGAGQFAQAIPPLQAYVKLQPEDPAGHYQLAIAYARTGNKEGASREMALQTQAASRGKTTDNAEGHAVHP